MAVRLTQVAQSPLSCHGNPRISPALVRSDLNKEKYFQKTKIKSWIDLQYLPETGLAVCEGLEGVVAVFTTDST